MRDTKGHVFDFEKEMLNNKYIFEKVSHPHKQLRLIPYLNLHLAPGLIPVPLPNHYTATISFQDIDNAVIFW